jgi:hypothetical protein
MSSIFLLSEHFAMIDECYASNLILKESSEKLAILLQQQRETQKQQSDFEKKTDTRNLADILAKHAENAQAHVLAIRAALPADMHEFGNDYIPSDFSIARNMNLIANARTRLAQLCEQRDHALYAQAIHERGMEEFAFKLKQLNEQVEEEEAVFEASSYRHASARIVRANAIALVAKCY